MFGPQPISRSAGEAGSTGAGGRGHFFEGLVISGLGLDEVRNTYLSPFIYTRPVDHVIDGQYNFGGCSLCPEML